MSQAQAGRQPRILAIMGSGETAPTMVKVHRSLLNRLGERSGETGGGVVMLDTPFGFQENATELCDKSIQYFSTSLSTKLEIASFRRRSDAGTVAYSEAMDRLSKAQYVFAGPGSPTYALSTWRDSAVPAALAEKLNRGGIVTFASAAALTLGAFTVPVYEIYKVGEDPRWEEGLGLLSLAGIDAAVIPHYNNAEGGTHDTRFCYLGERRLSILEQVLPEGCFVLGIDEHTAAVIDLEDRTVSVQGNGVMTIRSGGHSEELPSGSEIGIDEMVKRANELGSGLTPGGAPANGAAVPATASSPAAANAPATASPLGAAAKATATASPLVTAARNFKEAFDQASSVADMESACGAIIGLDNELTAWATDPSQTNDAELARAILHGMILDLGKIARSGAGDPAEKVAPYVGFLVDLRQDMRRSKRMDEADSIRDRLDSLGIEVRDTPDGPIWSLR